MNIVEKYEWKLMWPFYLKTFFCEILFLYPLFGIFYFLDLGFSLTQIGILYAMYRLAVIIFEIPTGAIADIYGRKFSVVLGFLLMGITFISVGFVNNFYLICILFFLWGFFYTLTSGSFDAWFVDLLKKNKQWKKVHDLNAISLSIASAGIIISGILGSILVKYLGLGIIWSFTGMAFLVSALFLTFAKEDFVRKKFNLKKSWNNILTQIKESGKEAYNNDNIFYLILGGVFIVIALYFTGELVFFPLIKDAGFPEYYFGYLISICFSMGLLAPLISKRLIKRIGGSKKYLIGLLVLLMISSALILLMNNLYGYIAIFIIGYFLVIFYVPVIFSFFQSHLSSKKRATIDSIKSMTQSIVAIIVWPLVGYTADKLGSKYAIFIGAFFYIPAIIMYWKVKDKK